MSMGRLPPTRRTAPPTSVSVPTPKITSGMTNLLTRPRVPEGCGGTDGGTVAWVGLTSCTAPSLGSLLPRTVPLQRGPNSTPPRGGGGGLSGRPALQLVLGQPRPEILHADGQLS